MNELSSGIASAKGQPNTFTLSSPDVVGGWLSPPQYGDATGAGVSPALAWSGAPEGTRSFVVSMYDRDAPTGSGFWHWVIVDVPATATGIAAGAGSDPARLPTGAVHTQNDASFRGYAGISPPIGETHDYVITVKALAIDRLPVGEQATGAMVGFVSNMHVLADASIVAAGRN